METTRPQGEGADEVRTHLLDGDAMPRREFVMRGIVEPHRQKYVTLTSGHLVKRDHHPALGILDGDGRKIAAPHCPSPAKASR